MPDTIKYLITTIYDLNSNFIEGDVLKKMPTEEDIKEHMSYCGCTADEIVIVELHKFYTVSTKITINK